MHKFQSNPLVSEYPSGPDASIFKGILFGIYQFNVVEQ